MFSFFTRMFTFQNPIISVIIPNYNNADYLTECIESVLAQTYHRKEIVICDDGSTDDSHKILSHYRSHKSIKVIYNERNLGVSRSRDRAIREANGTYISTLDSDDYYSDQDKLTSEWKILSSHKKQGEEVIAFSNAKLLLPDGTFGKFQGGRAVREGDLLVPILSREFMIPRDFLFSREAYDAAGGYDLDSNLYEDWDLKIRLAKKYPFYYTSSMGLVHRIVGTGLSSQPKSAHIIALRKVFEKNIHLVENPEDKASCIKEFNAYMQAKG